MEALEPIPHKYLEIYNDILSGIESGELIPGMRLPAMRTLGKQYGCNYHTARHAFDTLERKGYVELKPGSGTFITERVLDLRKRRVSTDKVLRTTDRIGILLPIRRWGHNVTSLIDQLHHSAEDQRVKLIIRMVSEIDVNTVTLAREFMEQDCCCIILPWIGEDQNLGNLHDFVRASELPVVTSRPVQGLEQNCYRNPHPNLDVRHSGTELQGRYFKELGFRNIAFLGPFAETAGYFERKLLQYNRWVDRENLPNLVGLVDGTQEDFERIIKRWEPMKGELAIIACHDSLALEFIGHCRRMDITIPADFSIIGHNNSPNALRSDPPLSTMHCPFDYIANGMISHALALSRGSLEQLDGQEPHTFCIRESCGGRLRLGDRIDEVVTALTGDV
jgi:DNA-binding LacI/PurR family transcriptional regulator